MTAGVNRDTLITIGWLDLSKEPQILHVPDMAERYYSVQFTDQDHFCVKPYSIDGIHRRATGRSGRGRTSFTSRHSKNTSGYTQAVKQRLYLRSGWQDIRQVKEEFSYPLASRLVINSSLTSCGGG